MKKAVATLLAGTMMAAASPALAQSVDDDSPFTGLRVQGVTGFDSIGAGSSVDDDGVDNNDQSAEGIIYGVAAGYDIDFGGIVIGPEAEFSGSTAKATYEDGDFEGFGFGNTSTGRDIYLGLRAGAKVGDRALAYVKGGYTNARLDINANDGVNETNPNYDLDGYRIGGGLEYAISENMFINAEYRYSNYSKAEVDLDGTLPDGDRFDVDLDRHQVAIGLGVRF